MVIGLLVLTAIPTVTGVSQAFSAQKTRDQREKDERRMRKFNIDVECEGSNADALEIHNGRLVVRDDRVWIGPVAAVEQGEHGYVCECMLVEYPDSKRVPVALGLVSQVQDSPPLLNWIYVDKDTMELKYGNKTASVAHHIGPWDWTEDERYLLLEEVSGDQEEDFVAVHNPSLRKWQMFYDMDGDWLRSYVPEEWTKLQVRLRRTLKENAASVA